MRKDQEAKSEKLQNRAVESELIARLSSDKTIQDRHEKKARRINGLLDRMKQNKLKQRQR